MSLEYCTNSRLQYKYLQTKSQPHSQGLSSYRTQLAPRGGKMRDPWNEVD